MKARHYLQVSSEIIGKHRHQHATYRDGARKLQKAIAEGNGLCVAADLLEENLGVTEKGRDGVRFYGKYTSNAKHGWRTDRNASPLISSPQHPS